MLRHDELLRLRAVHTEAHASSPQGEASPQMLWQVDGLSPRAMQLSAQPTSASDEGDPQMLRQLEVESPRAMQLA